MLGITSGSSNFGLVIGNMYGSNVATLDVTSNYGSSVGKSAASVSWPQGSKITAGVTTDSTKSGIVAKLSGINVGTVNSKKLGKYIVKY